MQETTTTSATPTTATTAAATTNPNPPNSPKSSPIYTSEPDDSDPVFDVSGKNLELSLFDNGAPDFPSVEKLYIYRNAFNLMPKSIGNLGEKLKTLKFFSNEVNLFPSEFRDLIELECLQVRVSSIGVNGLPFHKLKALKELELSMAPSRPSRFPILAEIAGLKCLTKLAVCHFSIRYLPPEIGCLTKLEYLDISFNKMRSLPKEIGSLNALLSLKVANNKLVEVPAVLSSLQRLENLDLSRNRLTSLGSLVLSSMQNLRSLHLQYNKLLSFQVPAWTCCNLEGNDTLLSSDKFVSSTVEMDVFEATINKDGSSSCDSLAAPANSLSNHQAIALLNGRCFVKRRLGKRWKRRQYLQQQARQERLYHSRRWKADDHVETLATESGEKCRSNTQSLLGSESLSGCSSGITYVEEDQHQTSVSGDDKCKNFLDATDEDDMNSKKVYDMENCCSVDSRENCNDVEDDPKCFVTSTCISSLDENEGESYCSEVSEKPLPKFKRQSDKLLDNPKPRKSRRSIDDQPNISQKYSNMSFCGVEDCLPDGFYDAGRDRPFMSLNDYEQSLDLHSREVILIDREKDEELDAILLSAQAMVSRLKKLTGSRRRRDFGVEDSFLVASWLALFVSDHFGGSDRSCFIERIRKDVSGSNYHKPFVCTCATGNSMSVIEHSAKSTQAVEDVALNHMCEKSLQDIKSRRKSVVVPIGTMQFGVCRHRAVLMKYLCDRMDPPVPCELIRGYLDFLPHAWNAILVQRGGSCVRMIVDACRPHDIREEMDPEYFCRYVPLARISSPVLSVRNSTSVSCFPSISECEEADKAASSSLVLCKIRSIEAAAKVRTMKVPAASMDEIRKFEYTCLGEVRILGALINHPCIIEIYGHKISAKWITTSDEKPGHRLLSSAIFLEYVRGGSLKNYVQKLLKDDEKHVPVDLALYIARDVACALKDIHAKHIIHRDIKSENILIDLDQKKADGSPIVKVCDFDQAVPLRSPLHGCCISHTGISAPDTCVGTPRWMAPEVLQAMHQCQTYGLEVDIWSYGCLLLELLTLQVPYAGLPDSEIHNLLQNGRRPKLTEELEALGTTKKPSKSKSSIKKNDHDEDGLRFMVDIYRRCTNGNPVERPTAEDLYEMLQTKITSFNCSAS